MSFVSENNSSSGYKTCIKALKHPICILAREESQMAETLLHTRRACGRRAPKRETPPFWDPKQHDFLITILFSVFSRSDVGALWWGFFSPHPSMLVWKGLGNLETVVYFGFISFVVVFTASLCPRKNDRYRPAQVWERLPTVPSGRFSGAGVSLCHCERKSYTVPVEHCFSLVP